ncbi:MAG: MATE family efflux transporter [Deltaproteobacteria bacterium]|nr:MATE family efflux transporter [Deltaproteobacteria bacterium]
MVTADVEIGELGQTQRLRGGVVEVAVLAYPAVLQTLSDTLMQVVDAAIVGRLGVTELGAVGFGGVWLWTLVVVFVGTGTGVQTFVAQEYGAGRHHTCGRWMWQGFYTAVPLAALWALCIGIFFPMLLALLGPSPALGALATQYVHYRLFGIPALIANVVFIAFFRGCGDTRTPLIGTVVANLLNVFLVYGLVFGRFGFPAWGVSGAGAATAAANWTYLLIMLIALRRRRLRQTYATAICRPHWESIVRFARTSIPVGGQWVLDMISFALFSTIIVRMGDVQMAASQAMLQLLSLSFMQAYGISIASGALVGRYVGARDLAAAERTHRSALQLGMALAAIVAVLFVSVPETLLSLFSQEASVLALARPLLVLGALFQLIDAMGIIAGGALRGAGDTRFPFVVQTLLAWLLRLPLVYTLAVVLGYRVTGAWLGELGYVTVLSTTWLLRFHRGAWRSIRI